MQLQQKHRNVEGALNKYKYRIKKLVEEHNLELERKYRDASEVYSMTMQAKGTEFRTWQIEERSKIATLIVICPGLIGIPSYLKRWTPINNIGNTSAGGKRQYT